MTPSVMTDRAIIFQMMKFGYEPHKDIVDFNSLYNDVCENKQFCRWVTELVYGEPYDWLNCISRSYVHVWMGERCPIWARHWHVLLSVILSGNWRAWKLEYLQNHNLQNS
jgi:hypothetical protein